MGPLYPQASHTYFLGINQRSKLLDKLIFGLQHLGQYIFVGFPCLRDFNTSLKFCSFFIGDYAPLHGSYWSSILSSG
jgi:hypothetical protein